MILHEDNMACTSFVKGEGSFLMSKNIGLRYHYILEKVKAGEIKLNFIRPEEKLGGELTNELVPKKFAEIMVKILANSGVDEKPISGVV